MAQDLFLQNNEIRPIQDVGAFANIRYVVMSVLQDMRIYSMNEYRDLVQVVINGVRHMRLYHQASIEVAYLKRDAHGKIRFPKGYVDYIKIGVLINGNVWNLSVNDDMAINRGEKCGIDVRQIQRGDPIDLSLFSTYNYPSHFRGTTFISTLYGLSGGFNFGYYKVDNTARTIQIDGNILNDEIILEYKSTGISASTIIRAENIEPLKLWTHWQRIEYDPRERDSVKERRKNQFIDSIGMMRDFENAFTMQEILDDAWSSRKQTPKY